MEASFSFISGGELGEEEGEDEIEAKLIDAWIERMGFSDIIISRSI